MRKLSIAANFALVVCFGLFLGLGSASAQATRTWVSGVGDDANPCSRTAPCKTFAGAISKTAAGGEINALDSGGFGTVTITKSITILSDGAVAGVLAAGTNGINVSVAATDKVVLKGLDIEGFGTGLAGVRMIGAGHLTIANSIIRDFRTGSGIGVDVQAAAGSRVVITESRIINNLVGVNVKPTSGANIVLIDKTLIEGNKNTSVSADGAAADAQLTGSILTGSPTGVARLNGATVSSFSNNVIQGAGAPNILRPLR